MAQGEVQPPIERSDSLDGTRADLRVQGAFRYVLKVAILSLIYWGVAWAGFKLAPGYAHVTSIWFPSGIALAAVLRYGIRLWPCALIGPILFTQTLGVPWHLSFLSGLGDMLSTVVAALLLRRFRFDNELGTFRDTILLITIGAWFPTLFGGSIGAASLVLGGVAPRSMYFEIFKVWWLADMAGALTLAPLLLALSSPKKEERVRQRPFEALALFALLALACAQVFWRGSDVFHGDLLPTYIILPFIVWASLRFGLTTSSWVVMVSSIAAIYGCAANLAAANSMRSEEVLHLQIFMSIMSSIGLMLSAATTQQRGVERELRGNQRLLHGIIDSSTAVIYVKDLEGRYLLVNRRFEELFKTTRSRMRGQTDADIFSKEEAEAFREFDKKVLESGKVLEGEEVASLEDGPHTYISIKSPLFDFDGHPFATCGISTDITDRKREESDLQRTRFALERSTDAMFHIDPEGRILDVNETACQRLERSRDEMLAITFEDLESSPGSWRERWREIKASVSLMVETSFRTRAGRIFPVEVSFHFYEFRGEEGCLAFGRDITERRVLEDQLRQSQKMEAIGQLSGGIAHDFNNILSVIGLYSAVVLRGLRPDDPGRAGVQGIQLAAEKAAKLTRQLLAFSRKEIVQPEALDLGLVVVGLEPMLRRIIGENIKFTAVAPPKLAKVVADPGQIEQALLNLVVNARDSMPSGGSLTMEASEVFLDAEYTHGHMGVPPGNYVMLAVSDTGCGMSQETQARIFEPFFTTKERGKGTGLGLATVYGIVQQSGGHIWVYSELGKGTTFKMYFPRAAADAVRAVPETEAILELGRGEQILVVEDEPSVRELVAGVLVSKGYDVRVAADGAEALGVFGKGERALDLLVTDVIMPGQSGRELADQLAKVYPKLRVLYMSGYTDDSVIRHGVLEENVPFLQKPFTPYALLRKTREALDFRRV